MIKTTAITKIDYIEIDKLKDVEIGSYRKMVKPILSKLIAIILFFPASIIIMITSIFIYVDSPGPIFYSQYRLGQGGRKFKVFKLRTMIVNAEKDTGPVWTAENDPRITRVGRIIRKLRIDELPQLINVLKGDMAIIGPRPERPELTYEFSMEVMFFEKRLLVKPGITGLAQVSGGYDLTPEEKLQMDLDYIVKLSLILDLKIVIKTIFVIFSTKGAR